MFKIEREKSVSEQLEAAMTEVLDGEVSLEEVEYIVSVALDAYDAAVEKAQEGDLDEDV